MVLRFPVPWGLVIRALHAPTRVVHATFLAVTLLLASAAAILTLLS